MTVRRLLVANPNTSAEVTARYLSEARRLAGAHMEVAGVTGRFGPRIVSTEAENVVAAHSALDLLAENARGFDAAILAISFDSGLAAARQVLPLPVVGITEAALAAAAVHGPVGAVIFGALSRPLYDLVLSGRAEAGIEVAEAETAADYLAEGAQDAAALAAAGRLAARGAGAVAILGAALVGIARRIGPHAPVPVFDGGAAVAAALAAPPVAPPRVRTLGPSVGLSPRLAALLEGRWESAQ